MSGERSDPEVVEYDGFSVEYKDASHRYWLRKDEQRTSAISVTGALGILAKPSLLLWYGVQDSIAVLDAERHGELTGIPTDQAIYVVRKRGLGAEAQRDAGAARGTAVHDALEAFCASGQVPALGDYPEAHRGYVQALCAALIDLDPEPIMVEQIVGSPELGIAGRFDLIANVNGERVLLDAKTSARAHEFPDAHTQLEGYQLCFKECGIEPVDHSLILSLADSGHYTVTKGAAKPEHFLSVLSAYRAMSEAKSLIRAAEKAQLTL